MSAQLDGLFVSEVLAKNKNLLMDSFENSSDFIVYEFETNSCIKALVAYIDGLADKDQLNRDLIKPFIFNGKDGNIRKSLCTSEIKEITAIKDAVDDILLGKVAMFIDNQSTAFSIDLKGWSQRNIEVPDVESVVRGPKEGFIENIRVNTSLLRRKIKNNKLIFESLTLGKQTNTPIEIAYIKDIVNEDVLKEVKSRLNNIETDSILETGYIEDFIEESTYSPFSTLGNSQKPDVIAGKLLEGRIAIFCDGTPHVLTAPFLFVENFQSAEDYYIRPLLGSILRVVRFIAFFITTFLPALYVAFQSFHQEMIPTRLLITMAGSREDVPFPSTAEIFIMLLMLEILIESGTRIPKMMGSAVSIAGALVIGDTAVNAGIVSPPLVLTVAIVSVSRFVNPAMDECIIVLRIIFLLLASFMGLYGVCCGVFIVVTYLVSLRSFGVIYTAPLIPLNLSGLKDYMFVAPLFSMTKRPEVIEKYNRKRRRRKRRVY